MALSKEEKERRKYEKRQKKYNETHKLINGIDHKICRVCENWFPCNEEYFYRKKSYDGFDTYCKKCVIEKAKNSNVDINNRNKNTVKWMAKPENREAKRLHGKKYRDSGKQREWARNNKDKIREYNDYRKMNKKHDITKEEWAICKEYFNNSCAYCGLHIDEHFKSWKGKLKKIDLHKDHVDHNGANDLSNCVPACQSCNSSKWVFTLDEWYNEDNKHFSQKRLDKILQWLNTDYLNYLKRK